MPADYGTFTRRDAAVPEETRNNPTHPPVTVWPLAADAHAPVDSRPQRTGMTARQATRLQWSIIGLCVVALVLIFQPFWLDLYTVGAGLVVLGGLLFNLIPLCRPGVPARTVAKVGTIVFLLFFVVAGLAISAAYLYGQYLQTQ